MKRDERPASSTDVPAQGTATLGVLASLADTTWRVAVPTVLFSGFGIFVDKKLHTMPLYTLIGLVLGLVGAGALVWHQIQTVTHTEDTK